MFFFYSTNSVFSCFVFFLFFQAALRGFGSVFSQQHIQYCLSVPAMWNDQAKAMMRQAALQAGMISPLDPPHRLLLISEPEAAALYCEKKCDQFAIGHGQKFMICDAGGGTVDLIVFEVNVGPQGRSLKVNRKRCFFLAFLMKEQKKILILLLTRIHMYTTSCLSSCYYRK